MVHALTLALQEFQGALIIVSHDRHLLGNTVDEFYSIHREVFAEFNGDLKDYEKWLSSQETSQQGKAGAAADDSRLTKLDKKHQRQQAAAARAQLAPLRKKEKQLEQAIDQINSQLQKIEEALADSQLYESAYKAKLTELLKQQGELKSSLVETEEAWMEVMEAITLAE